VFSNFNDSSLLETFLLKDLLKIFRIAMSLNGDHAPIFTAVSSSARQLFLLLRCISFSTKAQVQITDEGLRFSAEESSVIEGQYRLSFVIDSLLTY